VCAAPHLRPHAGPATLRGLAWQALLGQTPGHSTVPMCTRWAEWGRLQGA
jgi:hypothetical protein